MHKRAVIVVLLAFPALAAAGGQGFAQDGARNEAFIGPVVKFTLIDQRLGVMAGLRGSWPVGRSWAIGFGLSALLGGAATRFVKDTGSTFRSSQQVWETAFLWVAEPGGNAEWTIMKGLRLTAGISYRLASKPKKEWLEDVNFSGPTATIAFKF